MYKYKQRDWEKTNLISLHIIGLSLSMYDMLLKILKDMLEICMAI